MDAQSQTRDVTPLVALIQSLACRELEEAPQSVVPSPVLLADCRDAAVRLGCAGALDRVQRLADTSGAERQRNFITLDPRLDNLVANLASRFLAPRPRAATEARDGHTSQKPTERSGQCAAGSHTPAPRS